MANINTVSASLDALNSKLGGGQIPSSATKVDALKEIYATLGGSDDVSNISTVYEMVMKISEVAEGGGGGGVTAYIPKQTALISDSAVDINGDISGVAEDSYPICIVAVSYEWDGNIGYDYYVTTCNGSSEGLYSYFGDVGDDGTNYNFIVNDGKLQFEATDGKTSHLVAGTYNFMVIPNPLFPMN